MSFGFSTLMLTSIRYPWRWNHNLRTRWVHKGRLATWTMNESFVKRHMKLTFSLSCNKQRHFDEASLHWDTATFTDTFRYPVYMKSNTHGFRWRIRYRRPSSIKHRRSVFLYNGAIFGCLDTPRSSRSIQSNWNETHIINGDTHAEQVMPFDYSFL